MNALRIDVRRVMRRVGREERGMTLAELMVTTALLGVVTLCFTLILASVQKGINRQSDRSNDNDQARLAVQQLDRDIRSGNLLYDPAAEIPVAEANYALRVYTQSFADVKNPGNRCVQWRLVDRDLQRRDWAISWPTNPAGLVSGWRTVATDVVNRDLGIQVFDLDSDPQKGDRIINVHVVVQTDDDSGSPVHIQASFAGRNTSYGYPTDVCSNIPPA
jgi:prepilin-type N-terminal cleavage/methylation domain-containing protein